MIKNTMPKLIHYCWFGGKPLPKLAKKCIQSWRKYLPDYEIKEWNETNFDVNIVPYTEQAYKAKKYAFVSDYARFWILYKYGGLYFDTDVKLIRPIYDIINAGPFMGCENVVGNVANSRLGVNPGLGLGVTPGLSLYREILDSYALRNFFNSNGSFNQTTVVEYTTEVLRIHGLRDIPEIQKVADVNIYPVDYFCPINGDARKMTITCNTVSIHYGAGSWMTGWPKYRDMIKKLIGPRLSGLIVGLRK